MSDPIRPLVDKRAVCMLYRRMSGQMMDWPEEAPAAGQMYGGSIYESGLQDPGPL